MSIASEIPLCDKLAGTRFNGAVIADNDVVNSVNNSCVSRSFFLPPAQLDH